MAKVAAVLSAFAVLAASCGAEEETSRPPQELTGVIVDVDGEGSNIRAFTLDAGGELYEVRIAADVEYGFDLRHLREHERLADPVRVLLEERDGSLYARRIDDA